MQAEAAAAQPQRALRAAQATRLRARTARGSAGGGEHACSCTRHAQCCRDQMLMGEAYLTDYSDGLRAGWAGLAAAVQARSVRCQRVEAALSALSWVAAARPMTAPGWARGRDQGGAPRRAGRRKERMRRGSTGGGCSICGISLQFVVRVAIKG